MENKDDLAMDTVTTITGLESDLELKSCCAAVYQSDWAKLLLGESLHPGGLALTEMLGQKLALGPEDMVLDVASGTGRSALFLAQTYGCQVLGVDFSQAGVERANQLAAGAGLSELVSFRQGDAESLPLPDASFDAILCECAFCTFPNKAKGAAEFFRVLKPGGRLGLSDLTRQGQLPESLNSLLGWVACIADARPQSEYICQLQAAGLAVQFSEEQNWALKGIVRSVYGKLLGAELLVKLNKITFSLDEIEQAKRLTKLAEAEVKRGNLGYAILVATKAKTPDGSETFQSHQAGAIQR